MSSKRGVWFGIILATVLVLLFSAITAAQSELHLPLITSTNTTQDAADGNLNVVNVNGPVMAADNGNGSTPNGRPFQALQDQIDSLIGDVTTLEEAIAAVESEIDDLEDAVGDNGDLIAALQAEIVRINEELAQKQDFIDGKCEVGSSIRQINDDGSVVCEFFDVASNISRVYVKAKGQPAGYDQQTLARAYCPTGYTLTGGGYSNYGDTYNSHPSNTGAGWYAKGRTRYTYGSFYAYANCIKLLPSNVPTP